MDSERSLTVIRPKDSDRKDTQNNFNRTTSHIKKAFKFISSQWPHYIAGRHKKEGFNILVRFPLFFFFIYSPIQAKFRPFQNEEKHSKIILLLFFKLEHLIDKIIYYFVCKFMFPYLLPIFFVYFHFSP